MGYDFSKINDKEFEVLVCDLLTEQFGQKVERFKPGKDGGVDGRFFGYGKKEVVIQCKHYLGAGYKSLIRKLKSEEVKKVQKLAPSDYILATSLPLSRLNKKEICAIFGSFISSESNIYGQEDLDFLLDRFPMVVEKHYKLWFTSTHVLRGLLNAAIKGRSEYEIERITQNASLYVETTYHTQALQQLKKYHVLIITGEPGIGKTTLAENLCLFFVSNGYEFLDIESSLSEAESAYTRGKCQVFLFDDFLGSSFLEAIENKKDSHVVKFINRVENDPTKRFILTSRSNILNSGILHSPYFQNSNIRKSEFQLEVGGFSRIEKARILYNHMWYSKLSIDFLEEIYKDKRYRRIVEHSNFNPRLVDFITDSNKVPVDSPSLYWKYVEESLANPKDIWNDCFKRQSNEYVRGLVCLCVFNGGSMDEEDLKTSYHLLNDIQARLNPTHTMKDFDSMVRLAVRAFLNRNIARKRIFYTLFNPSLKDYVLGEYCSDKEQVVEIFHSLRTISAITHLGALAKEAYLEPVVVKQIRDNWFDIALLDNNSSAWARSIIASHISDTDKRERIISFLKAEMSRIRIDENLTSLLKVLWVVKDSIPDSGIDFVKRAIERDSLETNELTELAHFVQAIIDPGSPEYLEFCDHVKAHIESEVEDIANSIDIANYIKYVQGYEGEMDIKVNSDEVYEKVLCTAEESLNEWNCSFLKNEIELKQVVIEIDIDSMVDSFMEASYEPAYEHHNGWRYAPEDEIDDLFERQ